MANYYTALAETYEILGYVEKDYISKIPAEILDIIRRYKAEDISFRYDATRNINEQNINKETIEILSYLNYNFWLNNEEKKEFDKIYNDNFIRLENEKRKTYNSNDIFMNKKTRTVNKEYLPIKINQNKRFFKQIINKLKAIIEKIL